MQLRIVDISRVPNGVITEPITLVTAKQHLRVDFTDDDAYITSLITQCRKAVENYCFVSIVPATVTLTLEYCGNGYMGPIGASYNTENLAYSGSANGARSFELPYGPVATVTSVSTINSDNTSTTLDPLTFQYYVRGVSFKHLSIVNAGSNSVVVYNAGYTTVPDDLILAILNEIAFRMENRGDSTNRYSGQNVGLSESSQYLASPFKRTAWL